MNKNTRNIHSTNTKKLRKNKIKLQLKIPPKRERVNTMENHRYKLNEFRDTIKILLIGYA